MSNLIPYFVLAVVALGFFAVCYAVFSGGDGESKTKEKSHKNISNKNNPKEFWIAEDGTNRGREYIWIGVGVVFLIISYLFEVIKGVF